MQRRTLTPPHTQVQPEGLPRILRDRHRPDALAPRIFGPGQTKPAERASWADVNDKPDGGNEKNKKNAKKKKGVQHEDFPGAYAPSILIKDPDAATHFNTAAYTGATRGASADFRDRHRPDALAPRIFGPGRTEPPKRASWADANDKPDGGN
ncbi:hypothetical protein CMV_026758 [Castanea mollissima]|uniref:Uncharacterized protein n=1 Tax=Castanea mollissima TaxID=60419 RepID=A0A8J4Q7G8_9ROSI|nr:hypothetical protein CMV_026758 [Castanea mollissima]